MFVGFEVYSAILYNLLFFLYIILNQEKKELKT
jgi:hypothetical protein